ncbi:MAG: lipid-A-disaccharide synthase [Nitrospirae bacterium]|nr:lipid-A-disaccharide synthase [Nitrospirota bacterium]
MKTVMIVTGESSGELYGSLLATALKTKCPDLHIIGIGGEKMKEAGVELIAGIASSFGISEMLSSYKVLKETFEKAVNAIEKFSPKLIVLIDYPDFNIRLAKIAKEKGIKIFYYVSPQVWAWRKGRVKTIAEVSDRIAVILPFEEAIYRDTGAQCEFVGHPVMEEIEAMEQDKAALKMSLGLTAKRPVLALLPGSRPHELKSLLPVMLDVVKAFASELSGYNYQFIMPVAPNIDMEKYKDQLEQLKNKGVIIKKENAVNALAASDMAVIASGTAALQAAFLETPMVVIYKVSPLSFFIAKLVVNVRYISLINLISDREVVKELLQSGANAKNIISELKKILRDKDYRDRMTGQFRAVKNIFAGKRPSARVAEIICEIAV